MMDEDIVACSGWEYVGAQLRKRSAQGGLGVGLSKCGARESSTVLQHGMSHARHPTACIPLIINAVDGPTCQPRRGRGTNLSRGQNCTQSHLGTLAKPLCPAPFHTPCSLRSDCGDYYGAGAHSCKAMSHGPGRAALPAVLWISAGVCASADGAAAGTTAGDTGDAAAIHSCVFLA